MSYYYTTTTQGSFADIEAKVIGLLKKEGFGILSDIDIRKTFKAKLDVEFRNYKILGACNPPFALKALDAEDKIGTMLPCNVIIQELDSGLIEVSSINPMVSMQAVKNEQLGDIAREVSNKLKNVIESITNEK